MICTGYHKALSLTHQLMHARALPNHTANASSCLMGAKKKLDSGIFYFSSYMVTKLGAFSPVCLHKFILDKFYDNHVNM
jgi:hypothetical protein